mmetsp:Transcript_89040/g.174199  ORF Transcript_89040/g.174199 Transcript_89040/m.174199 type:complete len:234 (+) Transcript_89040:290-991(+)
MSGRFVTTKSASCDSLATTAPNAEATASSSTLHGCDETNWSARLTNFFEVMSAVPCMERLRLSREWLVNEFSTKFFNTFSSENCRTRPPYPEGERCRTRQPYPALTGSALSDDDAAASGESTSTVGATKTPPAALELAAPAAAACASAATAPCMPASQRVSREKTFLPGLAPAGAGAGGCISSGNSVARPLVDSTGSGRSSIVGGKDMAETPAVNPVSRTWTKTSTSKRKSFT